MKQTVVLLLFGGALAYLLSSYASGAAANGQGNLTGATGGSGCSCHGSTSSIGTTVQLDSAGVLVTSYHGGMSYTIKISATNNTTHTTLSHFGFQLSAVKAANAGTSSAALAGTWGTLPATTQITVTSSCDVVEQTAAITATTGTGAVGTTYVESIPWTAPVAGTGSVKLYGVINAVNFNGGSSGDYNQVATAVTITEAVVSAPVASVGISLTSGTNPTCAGSSVTFTATPVNGGTAPGYQWKVNGNAVSGATLATWTTTTLATGSVVTCTMTSSLTTVTGSPATSTGITMTINPTVTPSVSIATANQTVCAGSSVTFTATPTNGGTPSYQWKVNGTNAGTNSATYTTTTLTNGAVVTCTMTSTATCASPASATSNSITMTISGSVTPTVSIATASTSVCPGSSVTFTATPGNGGTAPSYQWKVNGANVGTNSSTYTTTTLANNAVVTCVMTSSSSCASVPTATSNPITMTVNPTVTPSVSIATANQTVCAGSSVTFTATPTNGGTPSYQWKVNGANAGTNSATFTTTTLTNGAAVTCTMTSTATCASPASAISNSLAMTVNPTVAPSVSISTAADTVCSGSSVTFTATPTNGGTPSYQWKVNGTNAGTNSATYTTTTLTNGAVVTCTMTSTATCASPASATSNSITMTISGSVTPTVSISTASTSVCPGSSVTFTATPGNGGTAPSYQWKVNGANVGTNSSTYTTTTLANNAVVTCVMTSSSSCASVPTATSNPITMTVANQVPTVTVDGSSLTICSGMPDTFVVITTNAGTAPSYQWKVNGANAGTNNNFYITSSLTNNAMVSCTLTSSLTCASPSSVTSAPVTIAVSATVTPAVFVSAAENTICQGVADTFIATGTNLGSSPAYQWLVDGSNAGSNSPVFISTSLSNGSTVICYVTSDAACASPVRDSSMVVITVTAAPSVTITPSGALILCLGDSLLLTASGATSYHWTTGDTTSSIWIHHTDTADVTGSNGTCRATAPIPATVVVHAPSVAAISQTGNILTASTESTYQWELNGSPLTGDTSRAVTITQSGRYAVMTEDINGCYATSNTDSFTYVDGITGVSADLGVKLYPVPNQGSFIIEATNISGADVSIYDIYGQKLYSQVLTADRTQVRADLAPAIYFVTVSEGGRTETIKMQVTRE